MIRHPLERPSAHERSWHAASFSGNMMVKEPQRWKVEVAEPWVAYGLLFFSVVVAVSGKFLSYDFKAHMLAYPDSAALYRIAEEWNPAVFLWSSVTVFALGLANAFIKKRISQIRAELDAQKVKLELVAENLRSLFNGLLQGTAAKLGVANAPTDRLSLYIHDNKSRFVLCGRYSYNTEYRKTGRPEYPDREGCIGIAWREGWAHRTLPDDEKDYDRANTEQYGISAEVLASLAMRSRTFAGKRVDAAYGPVAVILYESMVAGAVTDKDVSDVLQDFCSSYAELIHNFRFNVPSLDFASARGF